MSRKENKNDTWILGNDEDDNNNNNNEYHLNKYWTSEDTVGIHKIQEDDNGISDIEPVRSVESMKRDSNNTNNDSNEKLQSFDYNHDDVPDIDNKQTIQFLKEMLDIDDNKKNNKQESLRDLLIKSFFKVLKYIKNVTVGNSPVFVPQYYDHYNILKERKRYKLNILQRVFVMLEVPTSCQLGSIISIIVFMVILLSCTVYVISTLPALRHRPNTCATPVCQDSDLCPGETICEPVDPTWNGPIELACVIVFTIEYLLRVILVGFLPPRLSDLIPHLETKFKLENAMISDEQSIFHFVKNNLQSGLAQRAMGMGDCDSSVLDEEEVHDVSSYTCSWYDDSAERKNDISQHGSSSHINTVVNSEFKTLAEKIDEAAKSGTAKLEERIKERLDMKWYIKSLKYVTSVMNLVDLAAILPFYIERFSSTNSSVSFIRILRLARVFRIFKMGKSSSGVRIIIKTMKKASAALGIVMFFVPLGIIFFGALIYLFEGGTYEVSESYPDGAYVRNGFWGIREESPYTSIPTSMYWAVVTSTTTGYGELHPTTLWGRVVAIVCMYYGVLLMALPITVIGNNFNREYDKVHGNNDEKMIYECLSDLAKITHDEILMKAQGLIPADTTSFKLSRLLLILTTFDMTKSEALREGLMATMNARRKMDKAARDVEESLLSEKTPPSTPASPSSVSTSDTIDRSKFIRDELKGDRDDLLKAMIKLHRSLKDQETA